MKKLYQNKYIFKVYQKLPCIINKILYFLEDYNRPYCAYCEKHLIVNNKELEQLTEQYGFCFQLDISQMTACYTCLTFYIENNWAKTWKLENQHW